MSGADVLVENHGSIFLALAAERARRRRPGGAVMATPWTDARVQVTPAWPAVVPADAYLDARRPEWAAFETCGKIRFRRMGRHDELPKILIDAGLTDVISALTPGG